MTIKEQINKNVSNSSLVGDDRYNSVQSITEIYNDPDELLWVAEALARHENPIGKNLCIEVYRFLLLEENVELIDESYFEYRLRVATSIASKSGLNDSEWGAAILKSMLEESADVMDLCQLAEVAAILKDPENSLAIPAYERAKNKSEYGFELLYVAESIWSIGLADSSVDVNLFIEDAIRRCEQEGYGSLIELAISLHDSKIHRTDEPALQTLNCAISEALKSKNGGLFLILKYMLDHFSEHDEWVMKALNNQLYPYGYLDNLPLNISIVGLGEEAYKSLQNAFSIFPEIKILEGDILGHAKNCVVSPANSTGKMDGGIDADYRRYFGRQIEDRVQDRISLLPPPGLNIGSCFEIDTHDETIPWLLVAPTVEEPGFTESPNVGRAMYAILKKLATNKKVQPCYCPLLGSGVGGVSAESAAEEMALAYKDWIISYNQENYALGKEL